MHKHLSERVANHTVFIKYEFPLRSLPSKGLFHILNHPLWWHALTLNYSVIYYRIPKHVELKFYEVQRDEGVN